MPTTIPGPDSNFISWQQAQLMIATYQTSRNTILAPPFQGALTLADSELFNVAAFSALIAVPGCAAIRLHYGMDDDLAVHSIFVAVDAQGNDIVPANPNSVAKAKFDAGGDPPVVEEGQRCPPNC